MVKETFLNERLIQHSHYKDISQECVVNSCKTYRCNLISLQFRLDSLLFALFMISFFCLLFQAQTEPGNMVPFYMTVCTHSNKKRNLAWLLWTELSSLLFTDSGVNKLRLEKWVLLVLLFSSLCLLTFLSVVSLYGKSLTTDWLHRKSIIRVPS